MAKAALNRSASTFFEYRRSRSSQDLYPAFRRRWRCIFELWRQFSTRPVSIQRTWLGAIGHCPSKAGSLSAELKRSFYLPLLAIYGKWAVILTFPSGRPTLRVIPNEGALSWWTRISKAILTEQPNSINLQKDTVDVRSMFAITKFSVANKSNIVMLDAALKSYRFRS